MYIKEAKTKSYVLNEDERQNLICVRDILENFKEDSEISEELESFGIFPDDAIRLLDGILEKEGFLFTLD